jgi:hypothetical protein
VADVIWAATDIVLTPATISREPPPPDAVALSPSVRWGRDGARIELSGSF